MYNVMSLIHFISNREEMLMLRISDLCFDLLILLPNCKILSAFDAICRLLTGS